MTSPSRSGMPGGALLLVALLLSNSPLAAQSNPLATLDGPVAGLTAELLEQALPARAACQELIRLVNASGAHWQLVREGAMPVEQYRDNYSNQREEWAIHWGSCVGRRKALPEGLPSAVLAWEARLIERLWLGVRATSDAYLEGADVAVVNERMATYRGAADVWSQSSQSAQAFWDGQYLEAQPKSSCSSRSEASARRAGDELWSLSSQPRSTHVPEEMKRIEAGLDSADATRRACERSEPAEGIQLRLQGRLLRAYRLGLEGLRERSDDAVRSAMEEAQQVTSRMARCHREYGLGGPVSDVCNPLPSGTKAPKPRDGTESTSER